MKVTHRSPHFLTTPWIVFRLYKPRNTILLMSFLFHRAYCIIHTVLCPHCFHQIAMMNEWVSEWVHAWIWTVPHYTVISRPVLMCGFYLWHVSSSVCLWVKIRWGVVQRERALIWGTASNACVLTPFVCGYNTWVLTLKFTQLAVL